MRLLRCLPIAVPAAAAVLLAQPAHAEVDMTLVVESVADEGYYVDSEAKYFKTDGALDLLRDNKALHSPVFAAVLPAGESPTAVLSGMMSGVQRKGTYAVIVGDTLQVRSNALPQSQVRIAYNSALTTYQGRPDKALVQFVKLLPRAAQLPPKDPKAVRRPLSETKVGQDKEAAQSQAATRQQSAPRGHEKEGGFPVLPVAAGGIVVVLLAGGGYFVWRRKKSPAPAVPGAAPQPNGAAPQPNGAVPPGGGAMPRPAADPAMTVPEGAIEDALASSSGAAPPADPQQDPGQYGGNQQRPAPGGRQ